jgi:hypothetical protein
VNAYPGKHLGISKSPKKKKKKICDFHKQQVRHVILFDADLVISLETTQSWSNLIGDKLIA